MVSKPCRHAGAVGVRAVLAGLPFALDAGNGNLKARDAPDAVGDKAGGRILHSPGLCAIRLLAVSEPSDLSVKPSPIVDYLRHAPAVHRDVIPGWHDLSGLRLGGIPRGRDVSLRSLKDDQNLGAGAEHI